ncbi:MAG: MFS transporter [Promethearchaeota archaeon]|jgi:DHA3 family macrolide efflux protein-like MFS transporter
MGELASNSTFRGYLIFWAGQLASVLGSSITQFAIIWWITETTGSTILLSIASFLYILPMTIVISVAGVLIDRWNRKKIIIVVDSLQACVMVIVILLFSFNLAGPILIIAINGILGFFQGFHIPTVSAIVPTMVPKEKLSRMNGINFFFSSFMQIIGPVLGATFYSFMPINVILWIDPLTFLIALVPLLLTKIPLVKKEESSAKKHSFLKDFADGYRTLKLIPTVFMMLLVSMFINFLLRPWGPLMPYFIKFDHGGTASHLALVFAFMNGGMLLGALVSSIKKKWKHGTFIYFFGELLLMISYGIIAISPYRYFLLMSFAALIFGLVVPIINTIYLTMMQLKVPSDKMGRVSSIDWAISSAISPIGAIIVGPLAELFGVSNLFLYCSIIGIIITLILWWIAVRRENNHGISHELL